MAYSLLMKAAMILLASALALTGCEDGQARAKAQEKLRKAISDVVCVKKQEDLKFAMADVVAAGASIPEDKREDTVWNVTTEVQKQGCGPTPVPASAP